MLRSRDPPEYLRRSRLFGKSRVGVRRSRNDLCSANRAGVIPQNKDTGYLSRCSFPPSMAGGHKNRHLTSPAYRMYRVPRSYDGLRLSLPRAPVLASDHSAVADGAPLLPADGRRQSDTCLIGRRLDNFHRGQSIVLVSRHSARHERESQVRTTPMPSILWTRFSSALATSGESRNCCSSRNEAAARRCKCHRLCTTLHASGSHNRLAYYPIARRQNKEMPQSWR